jgi:hypothetical protein
MEQPKRVEERTEKETAENVKIYNRSDSTHRKIRPLEYGSQPAGAWGEAYRRILKAREAAKKGQKA